MSEETEYNVAARYRTVRKHLDNLGYKQALSLDALPLIEALLADLVQTTDSLKHFKAIAQENIEACSRLQLSVDPYKCDNARLVRECNQLHLDLIEAKEAHQRQVKDLKKQINKLECECNDLQLASSRNIHKIKELEAETAGKSKKILELQGKCLKPTVINVGLAAKKRPCFPLRRPVLEAEPMPRVKSSGALPRLSSVEPKIIDMISMADHKMNCLSHEVTKLRGELLLQTDTVQILEKQLATKEKEIIRLRKMLEGGRSYAAVSKDCTCKKMEKKAGATHDVTEISETRILRQAKLELEQQLKEALNKQHDAMSQAMKLASRNEELEKELRDIDHVALAVEADCNSAVKENNRRVCRLQEKLEDVMTQVHVLERELTVERREVQELRADLEACRLEKRNVQRTLESTLDEKKQMTDKINRLTIIEKNLNDEIGRLSKESEYRRQDIIQLQYINKILEEQIYAKRDIARNNERDDQTRSKEKGEKNDHNKGMKTLKRKIASKNHRDEKHDMHYQAMAKDITKDVSSLNMQKRIDDANLQIASLQQSIQRLETERDHYRKEYINCREEQRRASEKDNVDLWTRICELKRELSDKEQALSRAQREREELSCEKENLEARLQTYKGQQRQTCVPCRSCSLCKPVRACTCASGSPISAGDISATKTMLERLERERDTARADVERLIEERDALRERLKMMAEAHTCEQHRLKENLAEVENRLKHLEKERQDLLVTQGTKRVTINGLEDQLGDVQEELRRTKQELMTQRTQYFQLRTLQDQTDQALGDVQSQLSQAESELNKAVDHNRSMEQQQTQLNDQIKELKQEINTLRSSMTLLDQEKDRLLMALDEKTEKIAALERELVHKDQQAEGMQQQIRDLQHKNEICIDQSAEQERQLRSLQLEMETVQRQFEAASVDRENAIQENRKLQDDLAAVTCEVRNMQRELESSRAESYDLKRQLQTYVSEVRRAEELLNRKENERTEMLNHFRSLSLEATVLENNNHSLESEAAEARGALQTARHQMLDLERQFADKDCLIKGYESQISNLTQSVANMETQLRQQADQRHRAEADLMAVRDLCVKLDQQKDALVEQLGDKNTVKAHYEAQLSRLKAEQSIIQEQITRDRVTVERLETLLDQARQESIDAQAANQELQNEISRLKQKVSELQSKLSSESAELRQYQNQAAEYSRQISELRRQVTNERFDRARREEESRRNSQESTTHLQQKSLQDRVLPRPESVRSSNNNSIASTSRYLQRRGRGEGGRGGGRNGDNVGKVDMDTARRTNRFSASKAGVVATPNVICACTGTRISASDCDIRYVNVIICPEREQVEDSRSRKGKNETPSEDAVETLNVTIAATSVREFVPSTFASNIDDTGKDARTFSLVSALTKVEDHSGKVSHAIRNAQLESVRTSRLDVTPKSRFETLLNLNSKDNNARPRYDLRCYEPPRIIPRGAERAIMLDKIKKVTVYEESNDLCVCEKIDGRNRVRYRREIDGTEIENFDDISKSKDESRSSHMYKNCLSRYEMRRIGQDKWRDRIVQTVPGSCTEDKSISRKIEGNSSIWDIQQKWMYVECLLDDTLKSLERTLREERSRDKNGAENRKSDTATQFGQRGLTTADFTRSEFLRALTEIKDNTKKLERQLATLNETVEKR